MKGLTKVALTGGAGIGCGLVTTKASRNIKTGEGSFKTNLIIGIISGVAYVALSFLAGMYSGEAFEERFCNSEEAEEF